MLTDSDEEAVDTSVHPPVKDTPAHLAELKQIQQLTDLRDRGVITAAEFEAKKAQLLERM